MEVLVVAAIIAVLVAIAIPTVTRSLEKSRRAADLADARGILAVLSTGYLDGDIHFTTETFQGHPVCAAVVVSREGMQCFVSGATEIRGVSYDNSDGTTRIGSGTDSGYSNYRDDTFEAHGDYWRSQSTSNLEAAMGRSAA